MQRVENNLQQLTLSCWLGCIHPRGYDEENLATAPTTSRAAVVCCRISHALTTRIQLLHHMDGNVALQSRETGAQLG
jgi:hypothetical protein